MTENDGFSQPLDMVCASCHPKETAGYLASSMAKSFGLPDTVPAGKVSDPGTGSVIRTEWRNRKMIHTLSEDGLTTENEIRYQIGAGKVGHSYAAVAGDFLVESPISYYTRYGWDVSPGFAGVELLDFSRVLTDRCLFCHTNARGLYQGRDLNRREINPISCERCHGETADHIRHPSAANVVNPARLPVRSRDSVCEQCHLEGLARVLNPGKALSDFRPGTELETTLVIYVRNDAGQPIKAVSQEEQLALSRCARQNAGKLWCGTCHNPHLAANDRKSEIKAICTSCHPALSPADHTSATECTSCHMPRRTPSDVTHAAITDHQIRARPDETAPTTVADPQEIRAWHEPDPNLRQRDLGMAYLEVSANSGVQHLSTLGGNLLRSLPPAQRNDDAPVEAALGNMSLAQGHPAEALPFFRRACDLEPLSAAFAMYLGLSLKRSADLDEAVRELRRSIQLDPSLERSYLELSALYAKEGKFADARSVLDDYLKLNPQSVLFLLTRNALTGDKR